MFSSSKTTSQLLFYEILSVIKSGGESDPLVEVYIGFLSYKLSSLSEPVKTMNDYLEIRSSSRKSGQLARNQSQIK